MKYEPKFPLLFSGEMLSDFRIKTTKENKPGNIFFSFIFLSFLFTPPTMQREYFFKYELNELYQVIEY